MNSLKRNSFRRYVPPHHSHILPHSQDSSLQEPYYALKHKIQEKLEIRKRHDSVVRSRKTPEEIFHSQRQRPAFHSIENFQRRFSRHVRLRQQIPLSPPRATAAAVFPPPQTRDTFFRYKENGQQPAPLRSGLLKVNLEEIYQAGFNYQRQSEQRSNLSFISPMAGQMKKLMEIPSPHYQRAKTTKKSRFIHKSELSPIRRNQQSWMSPQTQRKRPPPLPYMPNFTQTAERDLGKPELQGSHKLLDIVRDYSWRRKASSPSERSKALFLNTTLLGDAGGVHSKFGFQHREPRLVKNGTLLVRDRSTEEEKVQRQTNFIPGRVATANVSPLNMVRARMLTSVPKLARKKNPHTSEISFRPRKQNEKVFFRDYASESSSSRESPLPA